MHASTHARRRLRGAVAVAVLLVLTVACGGARAQDPQGFVVGASVADDLAGLAQQTFARFADAAPGVEGCLGHPRLEAASELDDLARYDPSTGTIIVRVPATAPSLSGSLVHELAHHLEVACASHVDLRPRFLAAQGSDPDEAWFDGAWADVPSEQFAEVVVSLVEGKRRRNIVAVPLSAEATQAVAEWLATGQ